MTTPLEQPELAALIIAFHTASGHDRDASLREIRSRLPSWVRVYDALKTLTVYCDNVKTPLHPALTQWASYIERVFPDGSAEVLRNSFRTGPSPGTRLQKTTEPKIRTAFELLMQDIEI